MSPLDRSNGQLWEFAIAANFTAEPVAESLNFWLQELNLPCQVQFAPYDQVFQQLLDPLSTLSSNQAGLNVVLVRLQDWALGAPELHSGLEDKSGIQERLESGANDLTSALRSASGRSVVPYLLCLCPASRQVRTDTALSGFLDLLEERIAASLKDTPGIHIVTSAELSVAYPVADYEDALADKIGHVPYTQEFFHVLGTMIARRFYAMHAPAFKALVLDCDQTIWKGVAGEEGPGGVRVDSGRRALQEFAIAQSKAGMMICLCSKNNQDDVWKVFEQNPGMVLKREDITAFRINWQPKSENLQSLAEELRIGLDSFVFLDDSAVECAEVQARSPEVLALQLPERPEEISRFLRNVWAFDRLKTTEEDRKRSGHYASEVERERLRTRSLSLEDFLASLELSVEISPMGKADIARVSQISQRTNQFNFTSIRRSESEIEQLCRGGHAECLVVRLRDRFGDYGLVGAMIFTASSGVLDVDNVMLSCRALGRRVEYLMLAQLGEIARKRSLERVRIHFISTVKNQPAREFLEALGEVFEPASGDAYQFEFSSSFVAEISGSRRAAAASNQLTKRSSPLPLSVGAEFQNESRERSKLLKRIAVELCDSAGISRAIAAAATIRHRAAVGYVAPQDPLQESLASLWAEMLKVNIVGIHDNFFELGGHSLLAMRLAFKIQEEFNVEFPLEIFLQTPVLAPQAERLQELLLGEADSEDLARILDEMERQPESSDISATDYSDLANRPREVP